MKRAAVNLQSDVSKTHLGLHRSLKFSRSNAKTFTFFSKAASQRQGLKSTLQFGDSFTLKLKYNKHFCYDFLFNNTPADILPC